MEEVYNPEDGEESEPATTVEVMDNGITFDSIETSDGPSYVTSDVPTYVTSDVPTYVNSDGPTYVTSDGPSYTILAHDSEAGKKESCIWG